MTAGEPLPLIDPESGRALTADRPWSLSDGHGRWPVVAGIPYLRVGRDRLRREALRLLDGGDERSALVALLADRDDHATGPPPDPETLGRLVDGVGSGAATLRQAMAELGYGPVADYFAHRWSTPTYLSGLALLGRHGVAGATVVEVACGIGHYLRELSGRGVAAVGVDVVFSKLWLAKTYLTAGVPLVCADAVEGVPLGAIPGQVVAFCHDAFYFLRDKPRVASELTRLAGDRGRVLIGHAHNSAFDHRGVSGEPRTPAEYAALFPGCLLYDDAELARSFQTGTPPLARTAEELTGVEAVALAWGPSGVAGAADGPTFETPAPGANLRLNPLLGEDGGVLRPRWPSARFAEEYADASGYLSGEPVPQLPPRGRAEAERLARSRVLIDLPERW